jgi:phosphatidylglycerol:prolipoprotein diacylglycerol transferase
MDNDLYGQLLLGGAFVVTQITALHLAERAGLDTRTAFWLTVAGAAGAVLGGSLWTALVSPGTTFLEALFTGERGLMGALVGVAIVVLGWLALTHRPILTYVDAVVPAAFLGYAIARMACLIEGHCFGIPTDLWFGITYAPGTNAYVVQAAAGLIEPDAARSLPVHPTQLYHAALGLAGFLAVLGWKGSYPGSRLALALTLYGAGRFAIEFLRGDAQPIAGPLDANHLACLVLLGMAFALWRSRPLLLKRTA